MIGPGVLNAEQRLYSLQDLEILSNEQSFEEFIEHVLDPRPSERDKNWKKMLLKVSNAFSKELMSKEELTLRDFQNMEKLWALPALKNEIIFKERRRDIGIKFLVSCQKKNNDCKEFFMTFAESTSNDDAETHFQLAKLLYKKHDSSTLLWKHLELALRSEASEFYCRNEFVLSAIWEHLGTELLKSDFKADISNKLQFMVHNNCMDSLLKFSSDKLKNPRKTHDREMAFHLLRTHSKIDQKHMDLFYTLYLLETPT